MQKLYKKHKEDTLDVVFTPEQWQPSPVIIKVVNPVDLRSRRFVLVWNKKGQGIFKVELCPLSGEWFWSKVAACACKDSFDMHHNGDA